MISQAAAQRCATKVYLDPGESLDPHGLDTGIWQTALYSAAPASNTQKKQLQGSPRLAAPEDLTPMQRTKLNALLP